MCRREIQRIFRKKRNSEKKRKQSNPSSVSASKELGEVLRLGSFSVFCFRKVISESS